MRFPIDRFIGLALWEPKPVTSSVPC